MKNKKIYFPTFGSGLGHASRTSTIAKSLPKNYTYYFSSFSDGSIFLKEQGFECHDVTPLDISWSTKGGASKFNTLINSPKLLSTFIKHISNERGNIAKNRPNLIFSDSRLSPIIAAKMCGIPSITILNQIRLILSIKERRIRIIEQIAGEMLGILWNLSNEILIPDLPPPYSICLENVNKIHSVSKKIEFIGFLSNVPKVNNNKQIRNILKINNHNPILYIQISGPKSSRNNVYKKIMGIIKSNNVKYNLIISKGIPEGDVRPKKSNNVIIFDWCPYQEIFEVADCIVMRGGHSTISKALTAGKPIISIPIINQTEQLQNAKRIEELGLGICINENDLEKKILVSINNIFSDNNYISNVEKFKKRANKYNAIKKCHEKIEKYTV